MLDLEEDTINNYINETLESYCAKDYIPEYLRKKYGFISKIEALKEIQEEGQIAIKIL